MRPHVTIEAPDGRRVELGHGDLIGRIFSATLRIDDPRVSEAHAMVSLRGRELRLLGLRGVFECDGRRTKSLSLAKDQRIALAPQLVLIVRALQLPQQVLALEVPGVGSTFLAGTCSLFERPAPRVEPNYHASADGWAWTDGDRWLYRPRDGQAHEFTEGSELALGAHRVPVIRIALDDAGISATRSAGGLQTALRVVAHFDSVEIHPRGAPVVVLNGVSARLVSELVSFDGPVSWSVLASQLWPGTDDRGLLRRRLDVNLTRVRKKLRDAGLRSDLVNTDGGGQVQLLLGTHDVVEDRT